MARIELMDALRGIRTEDAAGPASAPVAKFAQCERKDARLRVGQSTSLTELAETLMHRRRMKTERITENTLIRVAVDLLLAHAADLTGSTEDELRTSVIAARR